MFGNQFEASELLETFFALKIRLYPFTEGRTDHQQLHPLGWAKKVAGNQFIVIFTKDAAFSNKIRLC